MKWKSLKATTRREIDIIRGDRNIMVVLLLATLVYILFLGTIFIKKVETDVPIVVVDNDRSEISRTLIRSLDSHQTMKVVEPKRDFESAKNDIIDSRAQAIVLIPRNFELSLKSGQSSNLEVYLNTARFLPSNDINKAVAEVALTVSAGIRLKYFQTKGYSTEEAKLLVQPVTGDIRPLYNVTESYGDFLIPGLLLLLLQQTMLFGLSLSVAREREMNSLPSLYQESGGSSLIGVFGKGIPYLLLYMSYSFFTLVVIFPIFRLHVLGSMTALAVLLLLFLISLIGFTIFLSSFFKKEIQALQFLVFTSMPLFLLTGYSWPVFAMPQPLRLLTMVFPGTPMFQSFVRVTQMDAGWSHVWPQIIHLIVLCIVWISLAQWRVKKLRNENYGINKFIK